MTIEPEPTTASAAGLQTENAELRRRLDLAEAALDELRAEAQQRRTEVRILAESLPTAVSRHAVLREMLRDARHHPDKSGVVRRGAAKAYRAPRKAIRLFRERT